MNRYRDIAISKDHIAAALAVFVLQYAHKFDTHAKNMDRLNRYVHLRGQLLVVLHTLHGTIVTWVKNWQLKFPMHINACMYSNYKGRKQITPQSSLIISMVVQISIALYLGVNFVLRFIIVAASCIEMKITRTREAALQQMAETSTCSLQTSQAKLK